VGGFSGEQCFRGVLSCSWTHCSEHNVVEQCRTLVRHFATSAEEDYCTHIYRPAKEVKVHVHVALIESLNQEPHWQA
jgi:hypothetical protein